MSWLISSSVNFGAINSFFSLTKTDNNNVSHVDIYRFNNDNFDLIQTLTDDEPKSDYGEYLDFSLNRNSMIISRNVVYSNFENILEADVVEMDLSTKDTKVFMYKDNEKVNIKSKE